jgi:hypothetical protein
MPISIPTSVAGISIPGAVNGPLNLLYGNKYDKTNFRFPRDVGSNPTRQHVILFTIKEPEPIQVGTVLQQTGGAAIDVGKTVGIGAGAAVTQFAAGQSEQAVKTLNTAVNEAKPAAARFADGVNSLTNPKLNRKNGDSIALYIPDTVNVSYSADYNDKFNLTDALGKPYFLAQGAVSLYNTFKQTGSEPLVNTINKAGNDPFVVKKVAELLSSTKLGTNLTDIALNKSGFALNPQVQVLFEGIGFRNFQFDFLLTPYSEEEAQTIKEIIKRFKYASAPKIDPNGVFSQGLFMQIPDVFNIKFLYKGAENLNVHRIEECVLTNVNVDYAGAGSWATHNDGSPVQIRLTLQFTETVIIDKNKITEGY